MDAVDGNNKKKSESTAVAVQQGEQKCYAPSGCRRLSFEIPKSKRRRCKTKRSVQLGRWHSQGNGSHRALSGGKSNWADGISHTWTLPSKITGHREELKVWLKDQSLCVAHWLLLLLLLFWAALVNVLTMSDQQIKCITPTMREGAPPRSHRWGLTTPTRYV